MPVLIVGASFEANAYLKFSHIDGDLSRKEELIQMVNGTAPALLAGGRPQSGSIRPSGTVYRKELFSVHGNVKRTDVNSGHGQTSASVYAIMSPRALAVCFPHAGPCVTGGPYISSPPSWPVRGSSEQPDARAGTRVVTAYSRQNDSAGP